MDTPANYPCAISPFEDGGKRQYLTQLAQTDAVRRYKSTATSELDVQPGNIVVDLGCGAGLDLHRYAGLTGPTGAVIGFDYDPQMTALATQATQHLPTVNVEVADIHCLPLNTQSADRVHIDRVLQHVTSPAGAVAEAARILRPTGKLVCTEPDWATLAIDHPDADLSVAYTNMMLKHVIPQPTVGRSIPRLLQQAGLTVTRIEPVTALWTDVVAADGVLGLHVVTERALAAGHLTAAQASSWIDQLVSAPFLATMTLFMVSAQYENIDLAIG
ncbi:methyltransferase domain-containing protein [Mycobacterium sp. MS1601]|uniref:methyltransferase domain-containing protein n=1 Tax=Mycobacterium sp. MS1601 TaxID=1936029 RepID=UPI0009FB8181|nr:methyltransferase domain-containing protein [Mycobacterium sp. MS1601]